MDLSSLNVDVLLYLMKFVNPYDRFNLVLSGILKGFENVNEGIDLDKRIEDIGIELGLCRDCMCELEIRSLFIKDLPDESFLKILERLAEKGYLQNNQQLKHRGYREFACGLLNISPFLEVFCSMKNLAIMYLDYELTLKDLAHVFQSCPKLIELNTVTKECKTLEMAEKLNIQLRSGFQRLRRLGLLCFINNDSWPVLQEMLTWLKECEQLAIFNENDEDLTSFVIDGALTLDPNFAESLQSLNLRDVPAALVKWFLSVCLNIHVVLVDFPKLPKGLHKEIARLKKLKRLHIIIDEASDLIEMVRSCRQVEILQMDISRLTLRNFAEIEPAENMTDITLCWGRRNHLSLKKVLPVLKGWRQLRRLTFAGFVETEIYPPPFEVLSDFIMAMKNLSYLHLHIVFPDYDHSNGQLEVLRDKVNKFILPRRPNFKFDISHS